MILFINSDCVSAAFNWRGYVFLNNTPGYLLGIFSVAVLGIHSTESSELGIVAVLLAVKISPLGIHACSSFSYILKWDEMVLGQFSS